MTPEARKILDLIENLDQSDQAACDELNARFWYWINNWEFYAYEKGHHLGRGNYTNSLDAIKAVQDSELKGWEVSYHKTWDNGHSVCLHYEGEDSLVEFEHKRYLPTMQLAWLHALIQAIEFERTKND